MNFTSSQQKLPFWRVVYQSLIWNQALSNIAQYIFLVLTNIHCILILVSFQLHFITLEDQNILIKSFKEVAKGLILREVANFDTKNRTIVAIISLASVYILLYLMLHSTNLWTYYQNKKPKPWKEKTSIAFAQFHLSIGFWTINAFLMDYIHTSNRKSPSALSALSILLIVTNYIFVGFFSLYSYDPFLSSNALSSFTPTYQVLTAIFKAIAAPLIFLPSWATKWLFVTTSLIILGAREYHLLSRFSYYKYSAMKLALIFSTISCLFIFLIFLALIINSNTIISSQTLLFTQLLLSPFAVYAALTSFKKTIFQFISKPNSELKSPQDAIKRMFAILTIREKTRFIIGENARRNLYELGFWSLLAINHNPNYQQTSYDKTLKSLIETLLNEMVQIFPDSIRLKILQIHFGLQLNRKIPILTIYLRELPRVQFLTYLLYDKLQENMDHFKAENTIVDIGPYIEQENLAETFAKAIDKNVQDYLDFWKEYRIEPQIKVKQLFIQSKAIEKGADFIESFWNKHSETNKLFALTFYTTYSPYLRLLKAAPFQSYQLAQKYASRKQEETYKAYQEGFNESSLTGSDVICIHTCMNPESPGKILKVTSNIIDLASWYPAEAINKNIRILIPQFIAHDHQKILIAHLDNLYKNQQSNSRMHQNLVSFLLHKSGHILPCDIYLTLHPCVQENLVYVAFIKIKQPGVDQIILNTDGEIEGFTKEIGESLILTTAGHIKTNLDSVCSNFEEINDGMKTFSAPQEIKRFSIRFQEFSCLVDVGLLPVREKTYYILSLSLPEKQKNKLKVIENDIALSDELDGVDEFPETLQNHPKIYLPKRPQRTIQTEGEVEGIITTINYDEEKSPTHKKQQNHLLTHQGDSFLAEDHFNPTTVVTTQRSLLVLSPVQKDRPLIKTPTYKDSTQKRVKTRLEMTLPMIQKNSFASFFFLCMLLLMAASTIPLIVFRNQARHTLALVHRNGDTLSSLIFMLSEYTDLHGSIRFLWQGELGILEPDRWNKIGYDTYALFNTSLFNFVFYNLPYFASIVKDGNNNVRSNVYRLDPEVKKQIYHGTVPVYEMQDDGSMRSTRRDTLFDLSTELYSQTIKFVNSADIPSNPSNLYMMFILNNTLNGSQVLGEKEISILTEDSSFKLHDLNSFVYAMMIMVSLLAVSVFGLFTFGTQKFLKERNHFLDIFAVLNEASIVEHINLVKDFKDGLMLTPFSEKDKKPQLLRAQNNNYWRRRKLNRSGINNLMIALHVATIVFLLLVFSAYPILYSQVGPGNETLLRKMDLMVQSNMNCYYTVFAYNVIYLYIQEPNTQVKNKPIETVWLETYQKLTAVQNFISDDLLDPKTGMGSDPIIYKNAVGNLCDVFSIADPFVTEHCQTIGGGFLTRGVSGMNSFFMAYTQAIFLSFKHSNQTLEAAKEALDNTQAIIWEVFYLFIYAAYEMVDEHIRHTMVKDFDQLNRNILQVTIAFIIIYALVGTWLAWKIHKRLRVEMMDWRKMLRRIPYPVANESQHLKAFIKKTIGFL